MKLHFMLVRRVPPVTSPVLAEVFAILSRHGFQISADIAEETVTLADDLRVEHDVYVLKSHTELSLSLAGILDARGAITLNPYRSCTTAQNKIVASQRLRAAGIPAPRSWVTGDVEQMRAWIEDGPLIVKPYQGHRGAGVQILRTPEDVASVTLPPSPVLIQQFVPGPGEDLKVYVVGDEVFAVRKPFSANSFAVPGRPCRVSSEIRRIARRCGEAFGLGLYGIDVIEGADGPMVVDLNYFPGYKGVPGVAPRIADYIMQFARGRIQLALPAMSPSKPTRDRSRGFGHAATPTLH